MADFNANTSGSSLRESFDWYSSITDAASGPVPLWGASQNWVITDGRFAGSRALGLDGVTDADILLDAVSLGTNAAKIIFRFSFNQIAPLSGSNLGLGISFVDAGSYQCSLMFRSDGAIVLTNGDPTQTVIATFLSVVSQATWESIQGEIVFDGAAGSIKLWTAGQTGNPATVTPDYSATGLNTITSANSYANNIQIGVGIGASTIGLENQRIDDFHCHDETGGHPNNLVGDLRAVQQMASTDSHIRFTRSTANLLDWSETAGATGFGGVSDKIQTTRVMPPYNGFVQGVEFFTPILTPFNIKCAIYDNAGMNGAPGVLVATTIQVTTSGAGFYVASFTTHPFLHNASGKEYYIAFLADSGLANLLAYCNPGAGSEDCYSFPAPYSVGFLPTGTIFAASSLADRPLLALVYDTANAALVSECQEDGLVSFVYDNAVGDVDQYTVEPLGSTPIYIDAVVSMGFTRKSDAGLCSGLLELTSSGTVNDSPSTNLTTTFGYLRKTYQNDPHTAGLWSTTAVNNVKIGPKVTV